MKATVYYYAADTDCGLEIGIYASEAKLNAVLTAIFDDMLEGDDMTVAKNFGGNLDEAWNWIAEHGRNNNGMDSYTWDSQELEFPDKA